MLQDKSKKQKNFCCQSCATVYNNKHRDYEISEKHLEHLKNIRPNRRDEATINAILSAVITFYDYLYRSGEVRELKIFISHTTSISLVRPFTFSQN